MTRAELRDEVDAAEWLDWVAFFGVEPFGCQAEDERLAVLAAVVNNSLGGKGRPKDFRMKWGGGDAPKPKKLLPFAEGLKMLGKVYGRKKDPKKG